MLSFVTCYICPGNVWFKVARERLNLWSCFCRFNKEKLHSLVTERCYPVSSDSVARFLLVYIKHRSATPPVAPLSRVQEMTRGNRYKTIRWSFIESLEPPRVVHARCTDMVAKGNVYGQVTVRMHSRQVRSRWWWFQSNYDMTLRLFVKVWVSLFLRSMRWHHLLTFKCNVCIIVYFLKHDDSSQQDYPSNKWLRFNGNTDVIMEQAQIRDHWQYFIPLIKLFHLFMKRKTTSCQVLLTSALKLLTK